MGVRSENPREEEDSDCAILADKISGNGGGGRNRTGSDFIEANWSGDRLAMPLPPPLPPARSAAARLRASGRSPAGARSWPDASALTSPRCPTTTHPSLNSPTRIERTPYTSKPAGASASTQCHASARRTLWRNGRTRLRPAELRRRSTRALTTSSRPMRSKKTRTTARFRPNGCRRSTQSRSPRQRKADVPR